MLLSIIRQNQKLAAKRNPAFDRNRFAKFLIYFMVAFWAAYLIFIGVMLSFAFEDIFPSMEPYHIMNQGLIYLLILDFLLRFMLQPAMSQEIKPYLLMPVKRISWWIPCYYNPESAVTISSGFPDHTFCSAYDYPFLRTHGHPMLSVRHLASDGYELLLVFDMQNFTE